MHATVVRIKLFYTATPHCIYMYICILLYFVCALNAMKSSYWGERSEPFLLKRMAASIYVWTDRSGPWVAPCYAHTYMTSHAPIGDCRPAIHIGL